MVTDPNDPTAVEPFSYHIVLTLTQSLDLDLESVLKVVLLLEIQTGLVRWRQDQQARDELFRINYAPCVFFFGKFVIYSDEDV